MSESRRSAAGDVSGAARPTRRGLALPAAALCALWVATSSGATPRFYDDDPIRHDDDTVEDASGVKPWKMQDVYNAFENTLGEPGDNTPNVRAQNINTVDEVPDSSWFTNRVGGGRPLSSEEMAQGGWAQSGPAAGRWIISDGKSDGVSPGFTITDSAGQRWFLKFDADEHPGMASGSEVATSRLLWALGYNVPEYHVVSVRRDSLIVGDRARVQPPGAYARAMKDPDIDLLLTIAARNADGSFRAVASRALPGEPLGPFRFHGARPDDPNDIVPHEHRRELRGLFVFSAWTNHTEVRSSNTLDTLIREQGRTYVRHNLLDFGATLGSGTLAPHAHWEGFDYLVDFGQATKGLMAFGFYILPWRTLPFYESETVGRLLDTRAEWDPETWKPRFPNPAFRHARADDKFWAARKLIAIDDRLIRAAIKGGQFADPSAEEFLVATLAARRAAIGSRYLTAINPVVDPALDGSGTLVFGNAAVDGGFAAAPERYFTKWFTFDNATGDVSPIGEASAGSSGIPAPASLPPTAGAFVKIEIGANSSAHPAWATPVHAYFKRLPQGEWKLVGFERLPSGS